MNYEYELYHYGIKGMQWGVRRYQNYDGSLTAKGKRHYDNMSGTELHKKLQRAYDKSKGGMFGKNYGENVTRVKKEQEERETNLRKRLSSENEEYMALNNELKKLNKQYDDTYQKFMNEVAKYGDSKKGDKLSYECDRIEKECGKIYDKKEAIYKRELKQLGRKYCSDYEDLSIAALMDIGFDKDTAKSFTDRMRKEDKHNRAVYI